MTSPRQLLLVVLAASLASAPLAAQAVRRDPGAVARAVFTAIDAHDLVRAGTLLDDSFSLHYQGIPDPISKKDFLGMLDSYYASFPDMKHDVRQVWSSGSTVTVNLMLHATHKGAFDGVSATGRAVAVGGLHVFRVKNGKVVEWWAAEDDLGLYRQIGMVIKPPPATP